MSTLLCGCVVRIGNLARIGASFDDVLQILFFILSEHLPENFEPGNCSKNFSL